MHIPVIFEDDSILMVDKPSGIVVHPFDFSHEETILDFLLKNYPATFHIKNEIKLQDERIINLGGIVHKLDRDTSGVMIIAKTQEVFDQLKKQFTKHTIKKTYIAVVEGIIEQEHFRIDAPLGRGKKDYKQSTNPVNPRGPLREAVTDVKILKRNQTTSLVELTPLTGRTHQLRAHMSSIGHPIVGDIAYGSTLKSERILLHAASLTCIHNEEEITFSSSVPEIFTQHQ